MEEPKVSFLEYAEQFRVKHDTRAVKAFTNALRKQIKTFESGEITPRGWIKPNAMNKGAYFVRVGKLDIILSVPNREEVLYCLHTLLDSVLSGEEEFIEMIEKAYGK